MLCRQCHCATFLLIHGWPPMLWQTAVPHVIVGREQRANLRYFEEWEKGKKVISIPDSRLCTPTGAAPTELRPAARTGKLR